MRRIIFLDRDGTVVREPENNYQIDSYDKLEFIPGAISTLAKISKEFPFDLVMVTNQDGLGTPSFPEDCFFPPHQLILKTLAGEGVNFSEVLIDNSFECDKSNQRKPRTGLVDHYRTKDISLADSFVIGDRETDVEFAKNLGARSILLKKANSSSQSSSPNTCADFICSSWGEILAVLRSLERTAHVSRVTRETNIDVHVELDGDGRAEITTGIGFFDHMLEQIAKHAGIDLRIVAKGDLYVDVHHTIEDTALALGEAIRRALGNFSGIERFGFLLPMDEASAQISLDISGRPYLVWDVKLQRDMVGNIPVEMFEHFYRSLIDQLRCTLHIQARGANDHHIVESIFKGFARALRTAIKRDYETRNVPSTKGVL